VITIAGPILRMTEDVVPEMARLVVQAAADLALLWPLRGLREPMMPSLEIGTETSDDLWERAQP
jgi:hypothetical protein